MQTGGATLGQCDSIVRNTDKTISKEEDVVVCLCRIEHMTEKVENREDLY